MRLHSVSTHAGVRRLLVLRHGLLVSACGCLWVSSFAFLCHFRLFSPPPLLSYTVFASLRPRFKHQQTPRIVRSARLFCLDAWCRAVQIADDYVDRLPIEGAMRVLEKHLRPKPTFVSMVVTRPMKRAARKVRPTYPARRRPKPPEASPCNADPGLTNDAPDDVVPCPIVSWNACLFFGMYVRIHRRRARRQCGDR